jgi:glycerophosphoryl diester phosphodiesterase
MRPAFVALWMVVALMAEAAPRKILVHGHRGARAVRPENTLPAFEYAIQAGVDVLELDLAVTRDGVLVVSHDPHLNRRICQGPEGETAIHKLTFEQVRRWDCGALKNSDFPKQQPVPGAKMPSLDEVFALASRGSFEFNIETKIDIKHPDLAPAPAEFARLVVDAVRRHRLEKRVIIQSFDFRTLVEIRKIAPTFRLSALYAGLPKDLTKIAAQAGGVPIVSPQWMLVTKKNVKKAQQAGLQVVPWTANSALAWNKLIKAQVDAIISDDPAALIEYLKAKGLR